MKKAYTLFSILILISIFSFTALKIYEINSISSHNISNQHNYIQAKNHINFLEEYLKSLDNLDLINKIEVVDINYSIKANIKKDSTNTYKVALAVESNKTDVRLFKELEIIK